MKRVLFLAFLLLPFAALAQSETCPRVWRSGDSLLTDPAPAIQWLRDGQAIPGANDRWLLPTEAGTYAVEASSAASPAFAYRKGYALAGYVFDELHRPVEGASVRKAAFTATTDEKGRFSLWIDERKPETTLPVVLVVEKDGHWRNTSRQYVSAFDTTETRIMLHTRRVTNRVDATKGGEMAYQGFTLQLPPNAVQTESGTPYNGTILLSVEGSTPSNPDFGLRMPGGSFDAIDANGNDVMLYSYGYLSAEMTTEAGEKLELRPEARATLRFYLPWNETHRPDSVPLWHFNTETAIWEQEGWSIRNGSIYEGQVSHFSSWNCDVPEERGTVRGRVIDCNDEPVKGGWVRVGQREVVTDSLGAYWAFVPQDVVFDVWTQSDTLRGISVPAMEERTLEDLRGLDFSGLAVYNPLTQTLNVYVSGNVPVNLRLSIDGGQTWTQERQLSSLNSAPSEVRLDGGCTNQVHVVTLRRQEDCRTLDSLELADAIRYENWIDLLASVDVVSRVYFNQNFDERWDLLYNFTCLQELILIYNGLNTLPESIENLTALQLLTLAGDNLTTLPVSIGNLTSLRELDLMPNNLEFLPESIGNLTSLEFLGLSGNNLTTLPESIGNLAALKTLLLNSNRLTSWPESIGNLAALQRLELGGNGLAALPRDFGIFSGLRKLSLDRNSLNSLPESVLSLADLEFLNLFNNNLTSLPESIGNLTALQDLILSGNSLTTLPESIGNLTALNFLNLSNNRLTSLPESIRNLTALESLLLFGNPIPVEHRAAIQAMLPNTEIIW